jgi:hypothetical protein
MKYNTICIGIDQSYKNTGITISADGKILKIKNINLSKYKDNSERRKQLRKYLVNMVYKINQKGNNIICIIERIRLISKGFLNISYIESIGALNSVIIDVMTTFNIDVFSVDTRCWKSQVIGTSKPMANKFGVPEEKWPTVKWVISQGFRDSILRDLGETSSVRRSKNLFEKNGHKWEYDNDASDSAAISMFWFLGDKSKLKREI